MKDFIILTNKEGILFSTTNILEVLKTFKLISDEQVIGIVEIAQLIEISNYDYLTAHIGLS